MRNFNYKLIIVIFIMILVNITSFGQKLAMEQINDIPWGKIIHNTIPASLRQMIDKSTSGPSSDGTVPGWDDNGYDTFTLASLEHYLANGTASVHWARLYGIPASLLSMLENASQGPSNDGTVPGDDDNGYSTFTIASLEHYLTDGTAEMSWNRLIDIPPVVKAIYEGGSGGAQTVAFQQDYWVTGTAQVHWARLDGIPDVIKAIYEGGSGGAQTVAFVQDFLETGTAVVDWARISTGKPTTIAGYGITDAYTKSQSDVNLNTHANNDQLHLTPSQNTLMDGLSTGLTHNHLNFVEGATSNIQTQINTINTQLGQINTALDLILN